MKRMSIYEPAMCCDTGVCGVNVDPELVRISTVINNLKKNGITIERYNLSSKPMAFVNNNKVKEALDKNGTDSLPLILVDEDIVIEGRYPKNEEIMELFNHINHMGTTIIMVTHNKELVNSMHKRVVSIEDGLIVNDVKKGGYDIHV